MAAGSFALFCAGILLIGAYQASAGFYRFAALEAVPAGGKGRAAAWVVAGGIVAALAAPTLALHTRNALAAPMAGAYVCIAALAALSIALLQSLPDLPMHTASAASCTPRRQLWQRPALRQALLLTACGHGLMILLMNATPLAMQGASHALPVSAQVIQWHVLGMFAPSLLAGALIDRFGARPVALMGIACLAASACTALAGQGHAPFLASSLLLGLGWNLCLLAGTTLLAQNYAPQERASAQSLMEWSNGVMATAMSLGSGALMQTLGWQAINIAALPVLACMLWWVMPRRVTKAAA